MEFQIQFGQCKMLCMKWQVKLLIQSVLAHAPGGERVNYRLQWLNGRYEPVRMKSRVLEQARRLSKLIPHIQNGVIVEVGTGWELITPILFYLFGSSRIHTYDHVRHLRFEVPQIVINSLDSTELSEISGLPERELQERIHILKKCSTLDNLLTVTQIEYFAPGDACKTGLTPHSIDLFFTYEVLEHVPEAVLDGLVAESKRILKPTGIAYHAIEPGDHYTRDDSHINHYRYPEWFWAPMVKNNISYHNRLIASQFMKCFEKYGALISLVNNKVSEREIAALRNGFRTNSRFSSFSPEDLAVWYSEVIYSFPS